MTPAAREAIERRLQSRLVEIQSVAGGDINEAHRVRCADGREFFTKTNNRAPADMFQREAEGLDWLKGSHGLRLPQVIANSMDDEPAYLILEWLSPGRPNNRYDERLGTGLAHLHLDSPEGFGWHAGNYIGHLPQANTPKPTWTEFYRSQRLMPQIKMAISSKRLSSKCVQALDQLMNQLEQLLPDAEKPARLHGDLWSGNVHIDQAGDPVLLDPAVYGGHREIDLAMMKLFGGFNERTFDAYQEAYPLEPGWKSRIELNQLYPLLVHVNLFGGHYAQSVERIACRFT